VTFFNPLMGFLAFVVVPYDTVVDAKNSDAVLSYV
jgi:hypothetical protein